MSKDTWVLASEPEQASGYWLHHGPAVAAVEPEASVPPRAAENLVWLGRYAERAEDVVRMLRVVHDRRNEFAHDTNPAGTACVRVLLAALTHVTATYPGFVGIDGRGDRRARSSSPGPSCVRSPSTASGRAPWPTPCSDCSTPPTRSGTSCRSTPGWSSSSLQRDLLDVPRRSAAATLARVLGSLLALAGLSSESMVHDPGWHFLDAGRRIERGVQLAALLEATVTVEHDEATDSLLLESVLISAESIITYRRRYRSQAQLETVLDLLLLDPDNPRSLALPARPPPRGPARAARPGPGAPGVGGREARAQGGHRRSASPTPPTWPRRATGGSARSWPASCPISPTACTRPPMPSPPPTSPICCLSARC